MKALFFFFREIGGTPPPSKEMPFSWRIENSFRH